MSVKRRTCTRCGTARPLAEFAKDARRSTGLRSVCKPCDRAARAERRKPGRPKPGALVLVPEFPAPPPAPPTSTWAEAVRAAKEIVGVPGPRRDGLVNEVERTLEKLDPPPGPADAAIVAALYRVAELLDDVAFGLERVKDTGTLMPKYVQLLRELKATRASAAAGAPSKPVGKLGRFGAAGSA